MLVLCSLLTTWAEPAGDQQSVAQVVPEAVVRGSLPGEKGGQAKRPNIIFILGDDMGYDSVQSNNQKSGIRTPNLDRLAKEGMNFTDAHSDSSVCTPSRYC